MNLIADVSGIADILMVSSSSFMGLFITSRMLESYLVAHLGHVYKKKQTNTPVVENTTKEKLTLKVMDELRLRV